MAKIGLFTRKSDNHYDGMLETITIKKAVRMMPVTMSVRQNLAPSHLLLAGHSEIGRAFPMRPENGKTLYMVELFSPEFAEKITASLIETDTPDRFELHWNRPGTAIYHGSVSGNAA